MKSRLVLANQPLIKKNYWHAHLCARNRFWPERFGYFLSSIASQQRLRASSITIVARVRIVWARLHRSIDAFEPLARKFFMRTRCVFREKGTGPKVPKICQLVALVAHVGSVESLVGNFTRRWIQETECLMFSFRIRIRFHVINRIYW